MIILKNIIIENLNKNAIVDFYKFLCNKENVNPLQIKFGIVPRGIAAVTYNLKTNKALFITFDTRKSKDIEFELYHEFAHQLCLQKYKYAGHGTKFRKELDSLLDKYMYNKTTDEFIQKLYK